MVPPEQLRWYAECLPLRDATVVDVGANVGDVSAFFWSEVGPRGAVISVEPLRSHVATLRRRIAEVGAANWSVEACAISDHDGEVALVTAREDGGWGSVVAPHGGIRVPSRRLDAVASTAAIVKLDVEGHEYAILDDALPRLAGVVAWALELHMVPGRPLPAVIAQLRAHGLRPRIAGRLASDPQGPWRAVDVPLGLDWSAIPAMPRSAADPTQGAAKAIHVIATRAVAVG